MGLSAKQDIAGLNPVSASTAEWRNWQTRLTQNQVSERTCGFESHLGYGNFENYQRDRRMSQVEVLNATYMPLRSTGLARAIALVRKGEAVVEQSDPHILIRAQNFEIEKPLVIRLVKYRSIPIKYTEAHWSNQGVLERDNYTCAYCGDYFPDRSKVNVDHIVPRSQNGKNTWLNTICSCIPCNSRKRNRTPEQANMPLLYQPTVVMSQKFDSGKKYKKKKKK